MTSDPKCELCAARPAEVVVFRRRGHDLIRTLACRKCGSQCSRLHAGADLDLGEIVGRLRGRVSEGRLSVGTCGLCGASLADIVTDGRPGCCLCYSRFHSTIHDLIRDAQGHNRHVGKAPGR